MNDLLACKEKNLDVVIYPTFKSVRVKFNGKNYCCEGPHMVIRNKNGIFFDIGKYIRNNHKAQYEGIKGDDMYPKFENCDGKLHIINETECDCIFDDSVSKSITMYNRIDLKNN